MAKNSQSVILVTGATGNVGRQVVSQLLDTGSRVRALTRDPDSATLPDGVDVARGDLSVPDSLEPCLDGVESVFLVWPGVTTEVEPATLTMLAKHASRIASCVAARALIHERDIAAVAARALTGDGHTGAKYVLTGPATMTQIEQVHTIGEAIGRPLRFEEISAEAARQQMLTEGWPTALADGVVNLLARLITEAALVTSTVEEVTGTPARTFRQWAVDHAEDFR